MISIEEAKQAVKECYPNYRGRKIRIQEKAGFPSKFDSYWDGGTRSKFVFYNLTTKKQFMLPSNHPFFEANIPHEIKQDNLDKMSRDIICIEHTIFCGKDIGCRIYHLPEVVQVLPQIENNQNILE